MDNRDGKEECLIENLYKALSLQTDGAGTGLTFFVYLSFSREAPTDKLIESLLSDGYRVCCPRIQNKEMVAVEYGDDFTLSAFGVREPTGEVYDGNVDFAIVPLLAADRKGNRLGYGGGYYDKYLKGTKARRIGFCYDCQLVQNVPVDEWDERLDVIVTENQILPVSKTE